MFILFVTSAARRSCSLIRLVENVVAGESSYDEQHSLEQNIAVELSISEHTSNAYRKRHSKALHFHYYMYQNSKIFVLMCTHNDYSETLHGVQSFLALGTATLQ